MGYNPVVEEYDPKLAHALKYNIAEFSAFKETSFKKQVESRLTKNGKVLSWSEFKKEVTKLDIQYNRQWLKTEYDQTIANANSAEKFKEYQSQKHLYPNLEYKTIGDERVRSSHKEMDGIILPVDDPFWQKFLPPNDWGCRCYVLQTAEPINKPKENDLAVKNDFANNPVVSGKVFKENAYEKGLSKKEVERAKELAKQMVKKSEETWEVVPTKKGQLKVSSKHGVNERTENIEIASYFTNKYEHKIKLLAVSNKEKTADAFNETLGIKQEYKRPTRATKNAIDKAIKDGKKQADHIVLDIVLDFDDETLKRGIKGRVSQAETVKTITVIRKGNDKTYTRNEILSADFEL